MLAAEYVEVRDVPWARVALNGVVLVAVLLDVSGYTTLMTPTSEVWISQ